MKLDDVVRSGTLVDSQMKKVECVPANVIDAIAAMEGIEIEFKNMVTKSDHEIAGDITSIFQLNPEIQECGVTVKVINAWVFLYGKPQRGDQKDAATTAVSNVTGVRGITNRMTISPKERILPQRFN